MFKKLSICCSLLALIGCSSATVTATSTATITASRTTSPEPTQAELLVDTMGARFVEKFCDDVRDVGTVLSKAILESRWTRKDVTWQAAWRELMSRC